GWRRRGPAPWAGRARAHAGAAARAGGDRGGPRSRASCRARRGGRRRGGRGRRRARPRRRRGAGGRARVSRRRDRSPLRRRRGGWGGRGASASPRRAHERERDPIALAGEREPLEADVMALDLVLLTREEAAQDEDAARRDAGADRRGERDEHARLDVGEAV